MRWGCMSSHGVGRLHIVSGTVKAMDYIEILQNKLLPTARDLLGNQSWIFQDDNAPCHRGKSVLLNSSVHPCEKRVYQLVGNKIVLHPVLADIAPNTICYSRQGPVQPMPYLVPHAISHTDEK
ncbi:hypothetical protein TNCV_3739021 [Trichonephila clavipes]|nr:hypothetical protein TNCV_3739021 [Trichonephila clavipes]